MSCQAKDDKHWEQYQKPKEAKNETEYKKLAIEGKARRIALSLICGSSVGELLFFLDSTKLIFLMVQKLVFLATIIANQFVNNRDRIFR